MLTLARFVSVIVKYVFTPWAQLAPTWNNDYVRDTDRAAIDGQYPLAH